MATIREWLSEAGFDWGHGHILFQPVIVDEAYTPDPGIAGRDQLWPGLMIRMNHPVLDLEFASGFGSPECPRFFAKDRAAIYFPAQHDGATWCERVPIDFLAYTGPDFEPTPYPGG